MHYIQQKILKLAREMDLSDMGLRKLGNMIDEKFPQKIKHHLERLEKVGLVKLDEGKNRIIKVIGHNQKDKKMGLKLIMLPILGSANAGIATVFADQEKHGHMPVSETLLRGKTGNDNLFIIQVNGESLNQAKDIPGGPVSNNDYVIIDSNVKNFHDGDYVLSIIDGMANLKRFYKNKNTIQLVSESDQNIQPIILHADDLETSGYVINGKIIRVIKNCD
jgi:SOS-response transcriptional repressor LexA